MTDTIPPRLMPRAWFNAQVRNFSIDMLIRPGHSAARMSSLTEGERQLGNWLVLPPFQRPPVWTEPQQVRFIESAWNGLPLGTYCYNRAPESNSPYDAWLLDGQQRITAVFAYIEDAFPVLGYRYSELTPVDQSCFGLIPFTAMETRLDDEAACLDVYERLAYGGTPHQPKDKVEEVDPGEELAAMTGQEPIVLVGP